MRDQQRGSCCGVGGGNPEGTAISGLKKIVVVPTLHTQKTPSQGEVRKDCKAAAFVGLHFDHFRRLPKQIRFEW